MSLGIENKVRKPNDKWGHWSLKDVYGGIFSNHLFKFNFNTQKKNNRGFEQIILEAFTSKVIKTIILS